MPIAEFLKLLEIKLIWHLAPRVVSRLVVPKAPVWSTSHCFLYATIAVINVALTQGGAASSERPGRHR